MNLSDIAFQNVEFTYCTGTVCGISYYGQSGSLISDLGKLMIVIFDHCAQFQWTPLIFNIGILTWFSIMSFLVAAK